MATIAATITGLTLLKTTTNNNGTDRQAWLVNCSFGAYTGAADDAAVNAINTAVQNYLRDGRTATLRAAVPCHGGADTASQEVFVAGASIQALAISGGNATGNLTNAAGTELTSATASTGVGVIATLDLA
jgi:hypothetical protein